MSTEKGIVTRSSLQGIADGIRYANGLNTEYKPDEMGAAIRALKKTLAQKNITANGNYDASDDNLDGYSGVNVNVPNSYVAADEGKVVENGALVSQTPLTIDANGTFDTTTNDVTIVNVQGGGGGQGAPYSGTTPPPASLGVDGDMYAQVFVGGSIASDGECYIDSGVIPNALYSIEIIAAMVSAGANYDTLFGCRNGEKARFTARFGTAANAALVVQKSTTPTTNYQQYQTTIDKKRMINTFYKLRLRDVWYENGLAGYLFKTTNVDAFPYSIFVFANNNAGTPGDYANAKIKCFKAFDDTGELVCYLVGAQDGDGVACLYDLVTGTMKYNAGTGELTYNPNEPHTAAIYWKKVGLDWRIVGVA